MGNNPDPKKLCCCCGLKNKRGLPFSGKKKIFIFDEDFLDFRAPIILRHIRSKIVHTLLINMFQTGLWSIFKSK